MKKLLLTLMAGFAVTSGFSQSASSVVFLDKGNPNETSLPVESSKMVTALKSGNKSTAGGNAWFDHISIVNNDNTLGYYTVMYQDSNVVYQGSTGPVNVFRYGFGRSFDPTDSLYFTDILSVPYEVDLTQQPPFRVDTTNSYTIDSIAFLSSYERSIPVDDTMIIQYAKVARRGATPNGLYVLGWSNRFDVAADGRPSFASFAYDQQTNLFTTDVMGVVHTQKVVLDAAYFGDTSANGYSMATSNGIELTTPLSVGPNEVSIFWVTFKSAINHALGTTTDNANTMRHISYDINGDGGLPLQTVGSLEAGLRATMQSKYSPHYDSFAFDNYNVAIPNLAYNTGALMPSFAFHVVCATCNDLSVGDINGSEVHANAYPNPAQNMVKIPFSISASSDVEVSLTNTLGQVVNRENLSNVTKGEVTFNTASLPNGVYFYKVEANGKSATGRVVVSH